MTREAVDICLRLLKDSNKSRFDSYSIDYIPYYLSGLSRELIFTDNLSQNSCICSLLLIEVLRNGI